MTDDSRAVPWTAVTLLTAVGLALRVFHMSTQSLWFDEIGSVTIATTPLGDLTRGITTGAGVEPTAWLSAGYNGLLKLLLLLPHSSQDWLFRLSSVVIGTLTIPAFAWTASRIAPARAVIAATGLLAISPFHVWYSQEVRPYALLLLLVIFTVGALVRALDSNRPRWWGAVALGTTLALYTHPIALGLPAICGVVLLAYRREPSVFWRGVLTLAAAGAAFVPIVVLVRSHGGNMPADLRSTGVLDVLYAGYAYAVGFSLGPSTNELHTTAPGMLMRYLPLIALVAAVFGTLALNGLVGLRRLPASRRWLIGTWLALPLGLTIGVALATANPFNVRYAIVSFPAFVLLLGIGLADLQGARATVLALGATVLSAIALHNLYFDPRYAKEASRDVAAMLRATAEPGDLVVVNAAYMASAVRYYYPGPARVVGYPFAEGRRDPPLDVAVTTADLGALVADRPHVWLILSRTFHGDHAGVMERVLRARLDVDTEQRFPGIIAYRFSPAAGRR